MTIARRLQDASIAILTPSLLIGVIEALALHRQLILFFIYNKHFGVNEEIMGPPGDGGNAGFDTTPAIDCH